MTRGSSSLLRLGALFAVMALVLGLENGNLSDKKYTPGYVAATMADAYADVLRMKAEGIANKKDKHHMAEATETRSLPIGTLPASKSKEFAYTNIRLATSGSLQEDTTNRIGDLLAATAQGPVSGAREAAVSGARTAEVPQLPSLPEFNLPKLPKLDLNPFDNHKGKKDKKEGFLGLLGLGGNNNDETASREAALATTVPPVNPFVAQAAGTPPPVAPLATATTAPIVTETANPPPKASSVSNLSPPLVARVGVAAQPAAEPAGGVAGAATVNTTSEDLLQF